MTVRKIPTLDSGNLIFDKFMPARLGATALAGAFTAKGSRGANVKDYGALGNGIADDTAAINAAFAAAVASRPLGGGSVFFPSGTYKVSSTLTVPVSVCVAGEAYNQTIISTTAATGHVMVAQSACVISELSFRSSVTRTSGSMVSVEGSQTVVDHCSFQNYFVGISVGIAGGLKAALPRVSDCVFQYPTVATGGGGIYLINMASAIIRDVIMMGAGTGVQTDYGIRVREGDTSFIGPNCNIVAHGIGLLVDPPSGISTFAMYISNAMFDSPGTNTVSYAQSAMEVKPVGFVYDIVVSNTWFGNSAAAHGVFMDGNNGTFDGSSFTGCEFVKNGYSGVYATGAGAKNWTITGGMSAGNVNSGINAAANTNHFTITGHRAGLTGVHGANGTGVIVSAATPNYYLITGNNLTGNTTASLNDAGTGTTKLVANNLL